MDATMTQIEKLGNVSFGSWWCGAGNDPRTSSPRREREPTMRKGSYSEELVKSVFPKTAQLSAMAPSTETYVVNTTERAFALDTCIIVAGDRVFIQREGRSFTHVLHLGPRQSVWTKIPEDQVIVSTATGELVPLGNQGLCQGACGGHKVLGVFHKFRCVHLQQLRSQSSDLVVVRPTPHCWKDSHVDALLDAWDRL